jgi:hypothetical protein
MISPDKREIVEMAKGIDSAPRPSFGAQQSTAPAAENLVMRMAELRRLRELVKKADARRLQQASDPAIAPQARSGHVESPDQ